MEQTKGVAPAGEVPADRCEGLRERKKRATRAAIHRAAVELVEQEGLAGVTVERIAATADVSPRTLFNYFPTKQDAVLGFQDEDLAATADWLAGRPADEPALDGVREAITRIMTPPDTDPELRRRRRALMFGEPDLVAALVRHNIAVEHALVDALERRAGVPAGNDLQLRVTVAASLAVVRSCMGKVQGDYRSAEYREAVREAFDLLATGLG